MTFPSSESTHKNDKSDKRGTNNTYSSFLCEFKSWTAHFFMTSTIRRKYHIIQRFLRSFLDIREMLKVIYVSRAIWRPFFCTNSPCPKEKQIHYMREMCKIIKYKRKLFICISATEICKCVWPWNFSLRIVDRKEA
jgi:hypothetical protein